MLTLPLCANSCRGPFRGYDVVWMQSSIMDSALDIDHLARTPSLAAARGRPRHPRRDVRSHVRSGGCRRAQLPRSRIGWPKCLVVFSFARNVSMGSISVKARLRRSTFRLSCSLVRDVSGESHGCGTTDRSQGLGCADDPGGKGAAYVD